VNGSMLVVEDEEKKALKGEQSSETSSSGSQPLGGEEELSPSSSVRRPSWYELTLRDAQEKVEAPRSTFRERRPPKKFPNFMVLMSSIIDSESSSVQEETTNRFGGIPWGRMMCRILCQDQRENQFQVALQEVPSSLRGSVDVCSIRKVLPHRSKCLDVWKSSKSFYLSNLL
jgi:hypothetical protein